MTLGLLQILQAPGFKSTFENLVHKILRELHTLDAQAILIFSYRQNLEWLVRRMRESTDPALRQVGQVSAVFNSRHAGAQMEQFNNTGELRFLFGVRAAIGEGVNLQGYPGFAYVKTILLDVGDSVSEDMQVSGRAIRPLARKPADETREVWYVQPISLSAEYHAVKQGQSVPGDYLASEQETAARDAKRPRFPAQCVLEECLKRRTPAVAAAVASSAGEPKRRRV